MYSSRQQNAASAQSFKGRFLGLPIGKPDTFLWSLPPSSDFSKRFLRQSFAQASASLLSSPSASLPVIVLRVCVCKRVLSIFFRSKPFLTSLLFSFSPLTRFVVRQLHCVPLAGQKEGFLLLKVITDLAPYSVQKHFQPYRMRFRFRYRKHVIPHCYRCTSCFLLHNSFTADGWLIPLWLHRIGIRIEFS